MSRPILEQISEHLPSHLLDQVHEWQRNASRYLALRNNSTKDLGVRRKSGWTYIAVTGPQLDRAADVLARVQENEDGRQHPSVPTEEA